MSPRPGPSASFRAASDAAGNPSDPAQLTPCVGCNFEAGRTGGLDLARLHNPGRPDRHRHRPLSRAARPDGLVFGVIGSMHWYPSRSAAERVLTRLWPQIHEQMPEARLVVAGWGSDRYLGHLFPIEGAELAGEVASPEDFFASISTLLYPPERGSGFKVKVLEAMAYGRPVISNAEGLEGLSDRGRPAAAEATTDAEFVDRAVCLMGSASQRQALGAAARVAIETDYSPEPAVDRLLDAYERFGLIGSTTSRTGRSTNRHRETE